MMIIFCEIASLLQRLIAIAYCLLQLLAYAIISLLQLPKLLDYFA